MEELKENLIDIYNELTSGYIPAVRHHAEPWAKAQVSKLKSAIKAD